MKKLFRTVLEQILPTLFARIANKHLAQKINSEDSQSNVPYMDNIDEIKIDSFKQKYAETFEAKSKFEDKAKTNVIGITIAITVIMGASGLTGSLSSKYPSAVLHWISFSVLLIAIIYLLVSGIGAIEVLFKENSMSTVGLSDMSTESITAKEKYGDCINRNIYRNLIRNNILYSSYLCIRNALICMMVLFVLISIPFATSKSDVGDAIVIQRESSISYRSTISIPDNISITDINDSIIEDKTGRELVEDGTAFSFVNIEGKYFVQYKCFGSEIIVEEFSCFDNVLDES